MRNLILKQLKNSSTIKSDTNYSAFIPYTRHITDSFIRTRSGDILAIIKLQGFPFETASTMELHGLKESLATFWQSLSNERLAIQHTILRRQHFNWPTSAFDNAFCSALDSAWRNRLQQKRQLINEHYLTFILSPSLRDISFINSLRYDLFRQTRPEAENCTEMVRDLDEIIAKTLKNLALYQPKLLKIKPPYSESLAFLNYLINFEYTPVCLPTMGLGRYLGNKRLIFRRETFTARGSTPESDRIGAVLSLKQYPNHTEPKMLNDLLRLPHEMIISQSFRFINRQSALNRMEKTQNRMLVANDAAISLREQLEQGMDDVASGRMSIGKHHFTITLFETDEANLDKSISATTTALSHAGLSYVREDSNLQPAFWSNMPGNFAYIARNAEISTFNFASLAGFHNFPCGHRKTHWGEPLTVLETTSSTPYFLGFHVDDKGLLVIIGPTGSGKSLLMLFLLAQAQRYKPRTIFFDKDRGAEIAIRAMGGQYDIIRSGKSTGMNPLQLSDTPENRAFLQEWLELLVKIPAETLSYEEKAIISDAVKQNYTMPPEKRQLKFLASAFLGQTRDHANSLYSRLKAWHSEGDYAWLFDNEQDNFSLEQAMIGLDMTSILEKPSCRSPWLIYVFYRIEQILDGRKTILMLDEGWKLLDDPYFAEKIKDWQKTIRKKNGVIVFATQSAKDLATSTTGQTIIEQSQTHIFMPNYRADETTHCGAFGLSPKELEYIRTLPQQNRCFLIRQGQESVIARLDMQGMDDFITVLSGRAHTVALVDKIRTEHGDNPDIWLPHFHSQRKAA